MPNTGPNRRPAQQPAVSRRLTAVIAAALLANIVVQIYRALRDYSQTDFVDWVYSASSMLRSGNNQLYCAPCFQDYAQVLFHVHATRPLVYSFPALTAFGLEPVTYLSPQLALAVYLAFSAAAIGLAAVLAWRLLPDTAGRPLVALIALASIPGAQTLAVAQWEGLFLLALTGAVVSMERGRPLLAGFLLSFLLIKPQLVSLIPVFLVAARQWRVLGGFVAGGLGWVLSTFAILGVSETLRWPGQLLANRTGQWDNVVGLPSVFVDAPPWMPFAATGVVLTMGVTIAVALRERLHAHPVEAVSLAIVWSLVASPHLLPYDILLLAVPLLIWFRTAPRPALAFAVAFNGAYLLDQATPHGLAHSEALVLITLAVALLLAFKGGIRAGLSREAKARFD